jgi:Fic family protein
LEAKIEELESSITAKDEKIKEFEGQESELTELREFKASVEEEREKAERLVAIKEKFAEAGLEKDPEYFETNREHLLAMSEAEIEFMVQELVSALASREDKRPDGERESGASRVPNFVNDDGEQVSLDELAEALRERLKK